VVADQRRARNGRFIEMIGFHNPRTEPPTDELNEARALYWLNVGAQPSDAVKYILKRTGTQERFERLRQGESIEGLVAEAEAAKSDAGVNSRKTSHPAPEAGQSWIKARQAAQSSGSESQE
jgi:small subunit ribosomal protein S16